MNGSLNLGQFATLDNESTQAVQRRYCAQDHTLTPFFAQPPAPRGIYLAHIDVGSPGKADRSRKIVLDQRSPLVPPEGECAVTAS